MSLTGSRSVDADQNDPRLHPSASGKDDGVEFFGGSARASHLVLTSIQMTRSAGIRASRAHFSMSSCSRTPLTLIKA